MSRISWWMLLVFTGLIPLLSTVYVVRIEQNFGITGDVAAVGSLIGGVSTSVAVIWIIATCWMQNKELQLQRRELKLQRRAIEDQSYSISILYSFDLIDRLQASIFDDVKRVTRMICPGKEFDGSVDEVLGAARKAIGEFISTEAASPSITKVDSEIIGRVCAAAEMKLAALEKVTERFHEADVVREIAMRSEYIQSVSVLREFSSSVERKWQNAGAL